ncbi:hypothetical protein HK405_012275 [Cladochytrium tenue]|nr:hypothetical protein HK405_012275 [Cladochytrium tenue]
MRLEHVENEGPLARTTGSAGAANKRPNLTSEARIAVLEDHMLLRSSPDLTLNDRLSALESKIMDLERNYPAWSVVHFNHVLRDPRTKELLPRVWTVTSKSESTGALVTKQELDGVPAAAPSLPEGRSHERNRNATGKAASKLTEPSPPPPRAAPNPTRGGADGRNSSVAHPPYRSLASPAWIAAAHRNESPRYGSPASEAFCGHDIIGVGRAAAHHQRHIGNGLVAHHVHKTVPAGSGQSTAPTPHPSLDSGTNTELDDTTSGASLNDVCGRYAESAASWANPAAQAQRYTTRAASLSDAGTREVNAECRKPSATRTNGSGRIAAVRSGAGPLSTAHTLSIQRHHALAGGSVFAAAAAVDVDDSDVVAPAPGPLVLLLGRLRLRPDQQPGYHGSQLQGR